MTETSPAAIFLDPDDALRKVGSTGKALMHTEFRREQKQLEAVRVVTEEMRVLREQVADLENKYRMLRRADPACDPEMCERAQAALQEAVEAACAALDKADGDPGLRRARAPRAAVSVARGVRR